MQARLIVFKMILLAAVISAMLYQTAFAAPTDEVYFSVKAVIPSNQIDTRKTYFDLKMEPDAKQTLIVNVYNNSQQPLKVKVGVQAASTNQGGLIDYSTAKTPDASLKTPLSAIATLQATELTIPAAGSAPVKVDLTMPHDQFDGIILGGIVVTKSAPEENKAATTSGVAINNTYSYVVGVQLRETDTVVKPVLHLKSVHTALVNHHTTLVASVQNSEAAIVQNLTFSAQLFKGTDTTALKSMTKESVSMAPNSVYDFPFDWGASPIQAGDYRMHIKATSGTDAWEWDQNFTVGSVDAKNLNATDVTTQQTATNNETVMLYVLGGILLLLIVAIIVFSVAKRRKNEEV